MARRSSNQKVVPECAKALDILKYEIAAEMGLPVGQSLANFGNVEFATELGTIPSANVKEDYWGHIASRDAGAVGGAITSRLVRQAESALFGLPSL
jgi:hypothetical protein